MYIMVFLQFILCMYIYTVGACSISVIFQKFCDGFGGSGSSCCGSGGSRRGSSSSSLQMIGQIMLASGPTDDRADNAWFWTYR